MLSLKPQNADQFCPYNTKIDTFWLEKNQNVDKKLPYISVYTISIHFIRLNSDKILLWGGGHLFREHRGGKCRLRSLPADRFRPGSGRPAPGPWDTSAASNRRWNPQNDWAKSSPSARTASASPFCTRRGTFPDSRRTSSHSFQIESWKKN